jgi:Fe2+ or Zn2+ uptake regulation protein
LPHISLGTVYRNLKRLAEEGAIRELHAGGPSGALRRQHGPPLPHSLPGCGRVNDLPMSIDTRPEEEAARAMNYRIFGHEVEVLGLCPLCHGSRTIENESRQRRPSRSAGRVMR